MLELIVNSFIMVAILFLSHTAVELGRKGKYIKLLLLIMAINALASAHGYIEWVIKWQG